jgi:hypothetical protein
MGNNSARIRWSSDPCRLIHPTQLGVSVLDLLPAPLQQWQGSCKAARKGARPAPSPVSHFSELLSSTTSRPCHPPPPPFSDVMNADTLLCPTRPLRNPFDAPYHGIVGCGEGTHGGWEVLLLGDSAFAPGGYCLPGVDGLRGGKGCLPGVARRLGCRLCCLADKGSSRGTSKLES